MKKKINKRIPKYKFGAAEVSEAVSTTANGVAGAMGVSQGSPVGGTLKGIGAGLSAIPTPYTQVAGAVLSTVGSFWGEDGSVDPNTGEIKKGSGLSKLFGRSKRSLAAESNRIKTSIADREITEHLNYKYYSDPNNTANTNIFQAAEGGIAPNLTPAYLDSKELITSPDRSEALRLPYAEGTDTIPAMLAPGTGVLSEDIKYDDKYSFADVGDMINKSFPDGSRAKQLLLQKALNAQEMKKLEKPHKKNGIPALEKGVNKYRYNKNLEAFKYWDKNKNDYTDEYKKWVAGITEQDVRDIESGKYGNMATYFSKNKDKKLDVATAQRLMTDKKYGDWHKIGESLVTNKVNNPIDVDTNTLNWAKQEANRQMLGYVPSITRAIAPGLVNPKIDPTETVVEDPLPGSTTISKTPRNKGKLGSNLYKAASILTPLLDVEKAELVQYQAPIAKYRPTSVNIDPQRRAIDESYAMARYNQANVGPNTGAGMAYGLQAATNRAKQLSDVYSWQTNAQNNLIGQNVDTYNKWSADYASIMNNVYDKAAANRATARNINRQNRATALKNWGQITKDAKQFEMDRMKLDMLEPLFQYGYQNYDQYLKWKKDNGYG